MSIDNMEEMQFGHDEPEHEVPDDSEQEEQELSSEEPSDESGENELSEEHPDEQLSKENKKRDKAKERINQIQREKFQAINEVARLKAENEMLKKDKDFSNQAAMRQYDANVSSRLEKARAAQIAAIESGDAQAQADANIELAAVTNEIHELNNWKYKEELNKRNEPQYQQEAPVYDPYQSNDPVFQDWVEENPWFVPGSPNHDPDLAAYIDSKSREIDHGLIQSGYGFKIRDEDYFNEIDRLANQYVNYRNQQSTQRRDLNMKPVRGGASPVRGYSQGMTQMPSQRREILSLDERDMAKRMGVSDKDYLRYRLRDEQENGHRRKGGR